MKFSSIVICLTTGLISSHVNINFISLLLGLAAGMLVMRIERYQFNDEN